MLIYFRDDIVRGSLGVVFRFGTKARNSGAKRPPAGMKTSMSSKQSDGMLVLGFPPTHHSYTPSLRLTHFPWDQEVRGSTGIPVFAGFRESGV